MTRRHILFFSVNERPLPSALASPSSTSRCVRVCENSREVRESEELGRRGRGAWDLYPSGEGVGGVMVMCAGWCSSERRAESGGTD